MGTPIQCLRLARIMYMYMPQEKVTCKPARIPQYITHCSYAKKPPLTFTLLTNHDIDNKVECSMLCMEEGTLT